MINLILLSSCKDDKHVTISPDASDIEKQYFEDYESPIQKWGFINTKGNYSIKPIYDDVRNFENGLACVSYNGKWGVINPENEVVVPYMYLDMHGFSNGLALVEDFDKNKFYINTLGQKIIDCPYEDCYDFYNNVARVSSGGFVGFINKQGNEIEGMKYTNASDFKNGLAKFSISEKYGIIDTIGNKILPPDFSKITINNGVALTVKDGNYQYYDLEKNIFYPEKFQYGSAFEDDFAIVKKGDDYGIFNKKQVFTPFSTTKIKYLNELRWAVKTDNGYLIVNEKNEAITDVEYTNIFKFQCGVAGVEIDEAWGYIDLDGKELIAPQLPIIWDCSEGLIRFISNSGYGFFDTETNIVIAPKFLEARDFKEGKARVQHF